MYVTGASIKGICTRAFTGGVDWLALCVGKGSELLATRGDEHLNSPGAHQAVWAIPDLGEGVVGRGCGDIDFQI